MSVMKAARAGEADAHLSSTHRSPRAGAFRTRTPRLPPIPQWTGSSTTRRSHRVWTLEITNILIISERRGRISPEETDAFLGDLARLPIRIRHDADERVLLGLARKHQLTTYDASYVGLAARTGAAVATLDRRLAGAARAEDLEIVGE